jgi:WD40 repeat protein
MSLRIPTAFLLLTIIAGVTADDRFGAGCKEPPRTDASGDPLPDGAVARLGTLRLRHGHIISGAAFAGDGQSIVASDFYSGVHVWDAGTGKELRRFARDDYYCQGVAVSPDGKTLAVAHGNLIVRLYDPATGRELGALPKADAQIADLVFSHDGSQLAIGTGHQAVRLYDVATQRLARQVTFPVQVSDLAFAPADKLLVAAGQDGSTRLWDLARNAEARALRDEAGNKPRLTPAYPTRGDRLAVSGYTDGSVRMFTADGAKETGRFKEAGTPIDPSSRDAWGPEPTPVALSPDGSVLAARKAVHRIDLWDVETGKRLHTLTADAYHGPTVLVFSPDGKTLMSTGGKRWGGDNVIRLWDVAAGNELLPSPGHGAPVSSVAIPPDGKTIATAGREGAVHLWDRSGRHLARFDGPRGRRVHVLFSTDGRRLVAWASYGGDGTLHVWDAGTRQLVRRLDLPNPNGWWEAVSADGKTAAAVDYKSKTDGFYDLTTGQVVREAPSGWQRPVAFTPTGDKFVAMDGTFMSTADRKELAKFETISAYHTQVRFSADGRTAIAATPGKRDVLDVRSDPPAEEIAVIDPAGGREVRRFGERDGHFYPIDAVALSADGRTVVTVGGLGQKYADERVVILWETETGRERGRFTGLPWSATSAALSADGRLLVTGFEDTTALVWDATRPHDPTGRRLQASARPADNLRTLALAESDRAYAALWALADSPKETVAFLEAEKDLFAPSDVKRIQRWIADLDSDKFADRERASRELGMILDEAEYHLRKALQAGPSAEARSRIELLLQTRRTGMTGKELQRFRLIEVLERIATPSADAPAGPNPTRLGAVALLQKLVDAAPESRLSREAKSALERAR